MELLFLLKVSRYLTPLIHFDSSLTYKVNIFYLWNSLMRHHNLQSHYQGKTLLPPLSLIVTGPDIGISLLKEVGVLG